MMPTAVTPAHRTLRHLFVALVGGGLLGCAGQLPPPDAGDALRASAQWPGTTVAALDRGRTEYADHCSACHAPYPPATHAPDAWPKIVREMAVRSKLDETSTND